MVSRLDALRAMCREIEAAHTIDEVKNIRDKALALEVYARQALNRDAEDRCRQIRERAERECGKRLKQRQKPPPGRKPKSRKPKNYVDERDVIPSLDDLGITRDQSSEWQRLAEATDEEFEAAVAENRVIAIKRPSRRVKMEPINDDNLWQWGRLGEFERRG